MPSPARPPRGFGFAGVHQGLQEGARSEHDGFGAVGRVTAYANTDDAIVAFRLLPSAFRLFSKQILNDFLPKCQILLLLDDSFDLCLIKFFVGLCARGVHRRPFAPVEHPKLNARRVDRPAHRAAQRVDLAHDLPLADPANGRIAAHLPDGVTIGRQQRRLRPQPRSSKRRFGTGVSRTNHQDVVVVRVGSHVLRISDF